MTKDEIKGNAPKGATHYMDDDKGFDYLMIGDGRFLSIWCSRFSCWMSYSYIAMSEKYKPL